jgi:hypothetical protein
MRAGYVVLQPGPKHQHCHLGLESDTELPNCH